ncbi:hypothetical protein HK101_001723 [Irineochytrium annulatum]|nr:hypothetical protein HK101_001723 [Irineochytrium annulatum]
MELLPDRPTNVIQVGMRFFRTMSEAAKRCVLEFMEAETLVSGGEEAGRMDASTAASQEAAVNAALLGLAAALSFNQSVQTGDDPGDGTDPSATLLSTLEHLERLATALTTLKTLSDVIPDHRIPSHPATDLMAAAAAGPHHRPPSPLPPSSPPPPYPLAPGDDASDSLAGQLARLNALDRRSQAGVSEQLRQASHQNRTLVQRLEALERSHSDASARLEGLKKRLEGSKRDVDLKAQQVLIYSLRLRTL